MSKCCFVTGKKVMFGNNVSHSKRKTRRTFYPNLHKLRFWVPSKSLFISLKVSAKGLRIINKIGIEKVLNIKKTR
ncbi:MAG TPA: 50S ribosomal protein L28 [Candidatus Azoamicus sp. MARI]